MDLKYLGQSWTAELVTVVSAVEDPVAPVIFLPNPAKKIKILIRWWQMSLQTVLVFNAIMTVRQKPVLLFDTISILAGEVFSQAASPAFLFSQI